MRRVLRFVHRNKFLVLATVLLMIGTGCVSIAHETSEQLTKDAMKPITLPLEARQRAIDAASATQAFQLRQYEASGLQE